jgi:hypothetical protein
MAFLLTIDSEDGLAIATFSGECDPREAWKGIAAIRATVHSEAIDGVLIDVRDVTYTPSPDEVYKLANEFVTFLGRRRLAIVTHGRIHTEIARNMANVVARYGLDMQVFDTPDIASRWLSTPDERL